MLVTVKPSKATVVISGYFCKSPLHAVCDEKCQKYFGSTDVINLFLFPQRLVERVGILNGSVILSTREGHFGSQETNKKTFGFKLGGRAEGKSGLVCQNRSNFTLPKTYFLIPPILRGRPLGIMKTLEDLGPRRHCNLNLQQFLSH